MMIDFSQPVLRAHRPWRRCLLAVALLLLAFVRPQLLCAELPAPRTFAAVSGALSEAPQPLEIEILEGEGALNNIRQRTAREPIVEVKDENHKPVAGVLILFSVQPGGAGATFNGSASFSTYTDAAGRAVAQGFTPNHKKGKFVIKVTATAGAATAFLLIHQTNVVGPWPPQANGQPGQAPPGSHSTAIKTVVIAGAAVLITVLILILTHKSGTDITAGTGTVGKP
jgi:hypothetical protein